MSAAMAHACESRPLTIYLVAAEESGDRLGGALMRALAQRAGRNVRFGGVGGRDMVSAGLASLFPIDELGDIGVVALARRVPMILGRIRQAAAAIVAAQPDALVIIDSPDFTHRVARRVRKAAPSIPIIDYVSPSVWAWRPWRARTMRAYVDEVLAILPFEVQAHAELGGPPCVYVGHPLIEQLDQLRPNPADARRRLADPPILAALRRLHQHARSGGGGDASVAPQRGDPLEHSVGAFRALDGHDVAVGHHNRLADIEWTDCCEHRETAGNVGLVTRAGRMPTDRSLRHQNFRRDLVSAM